MITIEFSLTLDDFDLFTDLTKEMSWVFNSYEQ